MTYSSLIFVAYLMLVAGFFSGWLTWKSSRNDWAGWLKSFMLIIVAILLLTHPAQGAAALGLLVGISLLFDGIALLSGAKFIGNIPEDKK